MGDNNSEEQQKKTHLDQLLADLPAEDARVHLLHVFDAGLHFRCGHLRLRAPDDARPDRARLLVPVQDLRDAPVGDAQLARDDAGPHAGRRHLHDLVPDVVGQGAPVDEHPAELVHAALTWGGRGGNRVSIVAVMSHAVDNKTFFRQ